MSKDYHALVGNRIFVGSADAAAEAVDNEPIDVVYDLRHKQFSPPSSSKTIHTPLYDDTEEKQDAALKETVQQIVKDYHDGKTIYFHCNSGNGRGGAMATATLLELALAASVEEAEQQAQKVRPAIQVKPKFKESLKRLYTE